MEISGGILSLTAWSALIIVGVALISHSEHPRISLRGRATPELKPSDPVAGLRGLSRVAGSYLSTSRQRVWPIGYEDLGNRVRRGLMVALAMSFATLALSAIGLGDAGYGLAWLLLGSIPFAGIGCVMSATHTLILRMLPYRGPIVSTALGALVGVAAGRVLQDSSLPVPAIILLGFVYGGMIGIIEYSINRSS